MAIKIMFSAGELSGDEHGAALLSELQKIYPQAEFFGMGARNLRTQGLEILVDAEKSGSVMGLSEILGGAGKILSSWKIMKAILAERKPDLLIIINYSEFNLRLAKVAKSLGVKVLFYIPPQVWAWRPWRVKTINQHCDLVATIFPFEKEFYAKRGSTKVVYVGHPFANLFKQNKISATEREKIRANLGIKEGQRLVLLFPGSRRKELSAHLDFVFETFKLVYNQQENCQGVLVSAHQDWVNELNLKVPSDLPIKVVHGDSLKLLQSGDSGLIKSGTSNLQAVFSNLPFVMYYRPARLTAFFIRRFVKGISQYSIVNILRANTVPEIVGEVLSPSQAASQLMLLTSETKEREEMLDNFQTIINSLSGADNIEEFSGCTSASLRTAILVGKLINAG
jgi:lipid-A-disaccharide synthase